MSYTDRFLNRAAADPAGLAQATIARYGLPPQHMAAVLQIAAKLQAPPYTLDKADVQTLSRAYPAADPGWLAEMASRLHKESPAQRSTMFIGAVTADEAAMNGDLTRAGAAFREVSSLVENLQSEDIAASIVAKRGGDNSDASPPWRPETGSVRDLLEQQIHPAPLREAVERLNDGDEYAEAVVRNAMADRLETATERLHDEGSSLRDSVAAAFDVHELGAVAEDQFGISTGSDS